MAERTTKAQCILAFQRVVKAVGGEVVQGFSDPARGGKFSLSYEPEHGGYRIQQYISNDNWAIRLPFGEDRFSPAAFWAACYVICRAFEVAESLRKE